jgi:ribokinase
MKIIDVIGYGALNMDEVMLVDKIPKADEEGYVRSAECHPGGSAANTIVGLARLGLNTGYIGKIGDDDIGKVLLEEMRRENVDIRGIKVCEGKSGVALCFVDGKGNRAILISSGVNDTIHMEDIDIDYLNNANILHLTSFTSSSSEESFETEKKLVKEFSGCISFDPGNLYAERGMEKMKDLIKNSSVILPSEREIRLLTGDDYEYGSEILLREGVEIVAVKRGESGCYVTDGRQSFDLPAEKVGVVDTTGAGDAFNAGFLYGLIKGKDIRECGLLGNKVASFCIKERGAWGGLPRSI